MRFQPVTLRQTKAEKYGVWFETTNGYAFVVSPEDAGWVALFSWFAGKQTNGAIKLYSPLRLPNNKSGKLYLHHKVMEKQGQPRINLDYVCDHKNGKWWDCTRNNLRWGTQLQNTRNKRKNNNGLPFGVKYEKSSPNRPYIAEITASFPTVEEATTFVRENSLRLFGEWSPYYDHESGD